MKLYKYLPSQYLDFLLTNGSFLFRSLSYFQDYEDDLIRGDEYEGILKHTKPEGLKINNLTTSESFNAPWQFESEVDSENIFIFCVSNKLSRELAQEFKADVCVEFTNAAHIISKLRSAVSIRKKIKPNRLFHGEVKYYSEEEAPGIKWAFPNQIAMRKLNWFSSQEEYRFMFSLNSALEFNKTAQRIRIGEKTKAKRTEPYPEHILKIGNIKKWCMVHYFT